MSDNCYLAIDQSTAGTKVILLKKGNIIFRKNKQHQQFFPQEGWVEHHSEEILNNVIFLINEAIKFAKEKAIEIDSISITNQRETIVAWDNVTGKSLHPALVWQCNRSSKIVEKHIEMGHEKVIRKKTGLLIDTYFSAPKIKWLLNHVPAIDVAKNEKRLNIGTIDSWLLWNLTNGKSFYTESSNASRTMLYNITTQQWDGELLDLFQIPPHCLPEVKPSQFNFGSYKNIPILSMIADSQAALLGQHCLSNGEAKATLGTGCSIMMQVGKECKLDTKTVMKTIAWQEENATYYAIEGVIRSCGDTINWVKDGLKMPITIDRMNVIMLEEHWNQLQQDITIVPAQTGLATPYWKNKVPAAFLGMSRKSDDDSLMIAVLESIIFQIKQVLNQMEVETGHKCTSLCIDGGISQNKVLMQRLANILQIPLKINQLEVLSMIGAIALIDNKILEIVKGHTQIIYPKEDKQLLLKYQQWKQTVDNYVGQYE